MATRSTIGVENADGTVIGVYCHWDGYLANNGKLLFEFYDTEEKIRELISHGDISSLGPTIGEQHPVDNPYDYGTPEYCEFHNKLRAMTTYYGRDCGEPDSDAECQIYTNANEFLKSRQDYNYLFRNNKWYVRRYDHRRWTPITKRMIERD